MHFCQGEVEQIKLNHFDKNSCEMEEEMACCSPKENPTHCEVTSTEENGDCCKDVSYSDKFVEKQTVKIQKIVPISFIAVEVLQLQLPVIKDEVNNQLNFIDFYVASNAPPYYILYSQLTFYEG